jgi:putative membrane-bound dehydrogenase-like protein
MPRLLSALILTCLTLPAFADTYRVGVAQVDITPGHPIRLNGFGGRRTESEGVYQRIHARALAIEDDSKEPALLMTVDVLGIPDDIRAEVAKRLQKAGLKPERLAITATHTHTGPMLKGANPTLFGVPIPDEHLKNIDRYTAVFLDKLEQAGLEALKDRKPATLSYAIGSAGFAMNRRTRNGPVDRDLPTLFVHGPDGTVRAVYTNYACHCVTLSHNKVGGDWAGFAAEEIQSAFPGSIALVSVGCGADSNPSSGVTGDKVETARLQGREIATEIKRLAGQFRTSVKGRLTAQWKSLSLPLAALPTRAEWAEKAKRTDAVGHHARVQLAKLDRKEALATKIDYPIQTWAFGDSLAMVFLPGEVVVDYSLRLKKELDAQRLWVAAYANGAPCYIPSERILKEGGYEGGGAMIYYDVPVPFAAGLEEPITRVVRDQLARTFPAKFDAAKVGSLPLTPQQSLAAIKTKANLTVDLVAAEPLVNSPVAIDFGPDGKLWVAEMIDYPQGERGKFEPGGRIRYLEDLNGDGRFDRATDFLTGIPFPTGVTVWRKGVLVCAAPDILYAEDTNGDGKADVVKKLFSGFGTDNYQGRVNSLQYGLDGWVYGSCGLFGGKIKSFNGKEYNLGDRDFRIKPDTGELEPVTGRSQQGRVRDDWGNWFGCDNSTLVRHYALEDHYLRRNPHVPTPDGSVLVSAGLHRLYPLRSDQQRFQLSGPSNTVTAACGLGIYRDDLLGPEYRGNAFICEPVNLVVTRVVMDPDGATFKGRRADDEKDREFLASTDNWFRPVQAVTGPDGALWVVDMYRHVIEHPRWIPPQDAAKLDLRAGAGMGRIYRVRPKDQPLRRWVSTANADGFDLYSGKGGPNGWLRDMAAQLHWWADHRAAGFGTDPAPHIAAEPKCPSGRRHETWVRLIGLADLTAGSRTDLLSGAMKHIHPAVRRIAVRRAEEVVAKDPAIGPAVLDLANDPDPGVRLQVAYMLGAWDDPRAAKALADLALKHPNDRLLTAAVVSSLNAENLPAVVDAIFHEENDAGPPARFAATIAALVRATKNHAAYTSLFRKATQPHAGRYRAWQFAVIADRFGPDVKTDGPAPLLRDPQAGRLFGAARTMALDAKAGEEDRVTAVRLLGLFGNDDGDAFRELLSASTGPTVRSAAVAHIGRSRDDKVVGLLIEGWTGFAPATRGQILDVLLSRTDGAARILAAIDRKAVAAADIDAARRQRLLTHADASIRSRAAKAFDGAVNPDRAKILQTYAAVTANGDRDRGKAVFAKVCAACHKLGDVGTAVGPDLAALANRTPAYLLQEILDPNRNLDSRYVEYRATTNSGRVLTGLLASETATTIVLRGQQGKDETLLRTDIDELRASGKSLMPEGLEKDVPPAAMADLLAFLTANRAPPKRFVGNTPAVVKAADGRLTLPAAAAEIHGDGIMFEQDFKNVGMWHGQHDRAEWQVALDQAGTFDVYLDYACADDSARNGLVVDGGGVPIVWMVPATGGWNRYRTEKVGWVKLAAGDGRLVVRPAGPLRGALIDLRTVYLVPQGEKPATPQAAKSAAEQIAELAKGIADAKTEYERIPAIWRVAIDAGKRNDAKELRDILKVSVPGEKEKLRDWQAVVIGGGVINGISQAGPWPGKRLAELIDDRPRWEAVLKQAVAMADDAKVPPGTRYDALRMVALADWSVAEPVLTKYLPKGTNAELQMGAVSGLADVDHPKAAELLAKSLGDLAPANRALAIDGLLRTPERAKLLKGVKAEWLTEAQRKRLEKK